MMKSPDYLEEIEEYINRLRSIAINLRFLGLGILMTTLWNLGFLAAAEIGFLKPLIGMQMSALAFVIAILLAMMFEQSRRRGEVIYGEVTDELHRAHSDPQLVRPRLSFRIALKYFASSMELPLIPGRYGVSLYLLLNLSTLLFAFLTLREY